MGITICRKARLILCGLISLVFAVQAQAASMNTLKDMKSAFAVASRHASVPDSELVILLNEGLQQVCSDLSVYQKRDTVVTSDGNSDYTLNTDLALNGIGHVELKKDGKRTGLTRIKPDEIGKQSVDEGCPTVWYLHGQVLTVSPEGSALACTLIVTYNAKPSYFTADADSVNIVPVIYRFLAVKYALYRYYDSANRSNDAAAALQSYQAEITRLSNLLMFKEEAQ